MRYKWLNKQNNDNIIIFYNGWGMDEAPVIHLAFENYDVLMFYDYNSLSTDFDYSAINNYRNKYLIAWSMGVMTATHSKIHFDKKIAINGTLKPIDNNFGIPEKIYNLTIKGFSEESIKKFIHSMYENSSDFPVINREAENQKSELIALKTYYADLNFTYDKILISDNDKIIPTKNQIAFWRKEANLKSGHAPFMLFKSWREIL